MTNILNQVAKSLHSKFQPSSPDEYFALCLARRLGEPEAAGHYVVLASQYSQAKLLSAYRRAVSIGGNKGGFSAASIFHDYLKSHGTNGSNGVAHPRLMSVRVERRRAAVAVFSGVHLEGRRVLQLSSDPARAATSTAGFVHEMLSENQCASVAIECISEDVRRAKLHDAVMEHCRNNGIPVWEIAGKTVTGTMAHPPLKSRKQVRELMLKIWPVQGLKKSELCALDAFALGLYVQTDRLFVSDH